MLVIHPRLIEHQNAAIAEGVEHLADLLLRDVAVGGHHDVEPLCL